MSMIEENIFNLNTNDNIRTDKEKKEYWDNIKIIYDIFNSIIINKEMSKSILKIYITYDFTNKLINLFKSDIKYERNKLKFIIHDLYSKLISRRIMIRGIIFNYFNFWIIRLNKTNGEAELLDVMSSIISGFSIPLRYEHTNFFNNILIPLHKKNCEHYFENLNRCIILYLEKDSNLAYILLENLFKLFHTHNYKIKLLFLEEIELILDYIDIQKINNYVDQLMNIIVGCFTEYNIDLKNKTLSFFKNDIFISIIKTYKNISFNIIVPKLNYLNSWDDESKEDINQIKQTLKNIDLIKYNDILKSNEFIVNNNEINLFPENEEEEDRQIQLAKKLSQKEFSFKDEIKKEKEKKMEIEFNDYYENEIQKDNNNSKNKNSNKAKINLRQSLLEFSKVSKNYEIKEEEFDEEFGICPITQEYMNNPVLSPSGNYYEKSSILDWLKKHDTDPLTRQYLTADMLIEDNEYKKKIVEYRKKYNK